MNSKCRIKSKAWNMNATWIVKPDIWLCPECCIGFIITQNNFMHCLYLFTVKRSHQIEPEYFFKIRGTTQKWSDVVVTPWNWERTIPQFFSDLWATLWAEIWSFDVRYLPRGSSFKNICMKYIFLWMCTFEGTTWNLGNSSFYFLMELTKTASFLMRYNIHYIINILNVRPSMLVLHSL